jgi:hypothetical protein
VLGAVLLAASGCSSDGSRANSPAPIATERPDSEPSPGESPSAGEPSTGGGAANCPEASKTIANEELVRPGSLQADVDGDGKTDEVRLVVDPEAKPGCRAWVTVSTSAGWIAAPIDEEDLPLDLGLPALDRPVAFDTRAGAEVLVRLRAGASTEFFAVYTVVEGELRRVSIIHGNESAPAPLTLASGGSVGHFDAVDCSDDLIVMSRAVLKRNRYRVTRSFFTPGPVLLGESTVRERVGGGALGRFPEFAATPLGSCESL